MDDNPDTMLEELGPVDYLVIEFPAGAQHFTGEVAGELARLSESGVIRVLDLLIITKAEDGSVDALEIDDTPAVDAIRALEADIAESLAAEDVALLAEAMEPGSVAGVLVYENRWAAPFASARRAGGQLIANGRIPIAERPSGAPVRDRYVYYPDCASVPEQSAVLISGRSYTIAAGVHLASTDAEGVIFAHGGVAGGHSLFVQDQRLTYVFNWVGWHWSTTATSTPATPTSNPATSWATSPKGARCSSWSTSHSSGRSDRPSWTPCRDTAARATCGSRATAAAPRTGSSRPRRRAGAALPVRGLPGLLPPRRRPDAGDGGPAAPGA